MEEFSEYRFQQQVDKAVTAVKRVLETTRNPRYASEVVHTYDDKYGLAEYLTNSAIAAQMACLEHLGLTREGLAKLLDWASERSVTLRLKAEERCVYDREETRKEEDPTRHETKVLGLTFTDKVVTTITEYFWKFSVQYELFAYVGNSPDEKTVLRSRSALVELKTTTKSTPYPQVVLSPSHDVNVTWFLQNIDPLTLNARFAIDREDSTCKTPRRNSHIEQAFRQFQHFSRWSETVAAFFSNSIFPKQPSHGLHIASINPDCLFVPVFPLFEELSRSTITSSSSSSSSSAASSSSLNQQLIHYNPKAVSPVVLHGDVPAFLQEQQRSIQEKITDLAKTFPADNTLITIAEATIVLVSRHIIQISQSLLDGVNYIESMLRKQLFAAIGKEVSPVDFANYMRFHYRKLFRPAFQPRPFCYAIRRPDHYPEGTLSLEAEMNDGSIAEPIASIVNGPSQGHPMQFALGAATRVTFHGQRYLHAWVRNSFNGDTGLGLSLSARARQFSSFILMVGRIASATLFEPTAAIIIKNKDDLKIPLMLETIPTPKEFRDAIESLSPEQQSFAKSFRAMQLESTLFAVCVIQIKPQLEKLLKLPDDSLTKEIRLTQDILELLMKYQIPSDLLSFDGAATASTQTKIATVKQYTQKLQTMISDQRAEELRKAEEERLMKELEERKRREAEEKLRREAEEKLRRETEERRQRETDQRRQRETKDTMTLKPMFNQMQMRSVGSCAPSPITCSVPTSSAVCSTSYSSPSPSFKKSSVSRPPPSSPAKSSPPPPPSSSSPILTPPTPSPTVTPSTPSPTVTPSTPSPTVTESAPSTEPAKPVEPAPKSTVSSGTSVSDSELAVVDYTKIPAELDGKYESLDLDSSLRPTIINVGRLWTQKYQTSLLSLPTSRTLPVDQQKIFKKDAFDLLDALSRSGALAVDCAELHVVIAATHNFCKTVTETVVQDNVNPIEKVERSSLIIATTIHSLPASSLVTHDNLDRLSELNPQLFAL